jgi:ketosteroid isomerase-like protein
VNTKAIPICASFTSNKSLYCNKRILFLGMKSLILFLVACLLCISCIRAQDSDSDTNDAKAFEKLRLDLTNAFANGDTATIAAYHHPDVVKALDYNKFLSGRTAVINDLEATLQYYNVKFTEHKIESFIIEQNTATEISTFTIEGTPKSNSSKPFTFKGRSMVVYVRYKESPAGWALLREMVQTANE